MSDDPVDVALRALNARSHPGTLSREAGEFFLAAAYEAEAARIEVTSLPMHEEYKYVVWWLRQRAAALRRSAS